MADKSQETAESGAERAARQLFRYRVGKLMRMGYDFAEAEALAERLARDGLDWHFVQEQLLDRGCSLEQAKRIVL